MKKTDIKKALLKAKNNFEIVKYDCSPNFLDYLANKINNGINFLIINYDNSICDNEILKSAQNIRQLTSVFDCLLIIQSRADIVKLSCADGILLDENSIPFEYAKKILDEEKLFGYYRNSKMQNKTNCFDFLISDNKILY